MVICVSFITFRAIYFISAVGLDIPKIHVDEKSFRWALNEDAMATEKLAEGIRNFTKDARSLEQLILAKLDV